MQKHNILTQIEKAKKLKVFIVEGPHSSSKSVTENMYLAFSDWLVTLCLLPETLSPRDEDFEKRC